MKKRAFTLVELILVVVIGGILLAISTNWYIVNMARANNDNNRQVDLQSGVSTSLEMIKNVLKKTTQVHLVGKNVYDPDESLENLQNRRLDLNYNYIALSKNAQGNYELVNIVYNRTKKKFESFPLSAQVRNDNMSPNAISYDMKLYQNDPDYKQKVKKNIVNISVLGNVHDVDAAGKHINPENDRKFELTEDIYLPNINQVLISKHLTGGLDEITAIAYDNIKIEGTQKSAKNKRLSFIFAIDLNTSAFNHQTIFRGEPINNKEAIRRIIYEFLSEFNQFGKDVGLQMDAYVYTFTSGTMLDGKKDGCGSDPNKKYIYPLNAIKKYYGPYKLGVENDWDEKDVTNQFDNKKQSKFENYLDVNCKLHKKASLYQNASGYAKAMIHSLELMNQLTEQNPNEKKFFMYLTSGWMTGYPEDGCVIQKNIGFKDIHPYDLERRGLPKDYKEWKFSYREGPSETFLANQFGIIANADDYYKNGPRYEIYPKPYPKQWAPFPETMSSMFFNNNNYRVKWLSNASASCNGLTHGHICFNGMPKMKALFAKHPNDSRHKEIRDLETRYRKLSSMYATKLATSFEKGNNRPDTFEKAYLIGFYPLDPGAAYEEFNAGNTQAKQMLGVDKNNEYYCNYQEFNEGIEEYPEEIREFIRVKDPDEYASLRKYLSLEGTPHAKVDKVSAFGANDLEELQNVLDDVIDNIGSIMGVFDGPRPLRNGGTP